jgi:hypothetical protein
MYLAAHLIEAGCSVIKQRNFGPDIGIVHNGQRIWFEATAPGPGDNNNPDRVNPPVDGEVRTVPIDKIVLRLTGAIREKCGEQYSRWLKAGLVSSNDCYVVAVNTREIDHGGGMVPPAILRAALPIGSPYAVIEQGTGRCIQSGHQECFAVTKAKGGTGDTGLFLHDDYRMLGGLLVSSIDVANSPSDCGPFELASNPFSAARLPSDFRLQGRHYEIERVDENTGFVRWH